MVLLAIASVSTNNSPSDVFKDSILKFGENGEDLKIFTILLTHKSL